MTDNHLENYIAAHIDEEPPHLRKLNRDTHVMCLYANMCSGHEQGRLLKMLVRMIRPSTCLSSAHSQDIRPSVLRKDSLKTELSTPLRLMTKWKTLSVSISMNHHMPTVSPFTLGMPRRFFLRSIYNGILSLSMPTSDIISIITRWYFLL